MDKSNINYGLTSEQVIESRKKYGENRLTPPKKESVWRLFLEKFNDPIIRVLLVAAVLSLVISVIENEYAETIGIFFAIILATGVGFWFEYDASRKFDMLNRTNDDVMVKVRREGSVREVPRSEVVVGDIVILDTGEEVPADGELLDSMSLTVNESCLTGELSAAKTTDPAHFHAEATYPSNRLMKGSTVIEGYGTMRVTEVGDATEFGRVATQSTVKSEEKTPLTLQLERLAQMISVVGFSLAFVTFGILLAKDIQQLETPLTAAQNWVLGSIIIAFLIALAKVIGSIVEDGLKLSNKSSLIIEKMMRRSSWIYVLIGAIFFAAASVVGYYAAGVNVLLAESWLPFELLEEVLKNFMIAVTLIVVAVPEGLPMSVTLSLALSMRRMLKTNNLVRKMHACETMGAATVICTDKTGTLTQNKMQVSEAEFFSLVGGKLTDDVTSNIIREGIAANTTAHIDRTGEQLNTIGNPTEGALLLWLESNGVDYNALREKAVIVDRLPFSTERKFMATLVDSGCGLGRVLYLKGAPEIVFSKCNKILIDGAVSSPEGYAKELEQKLFGYQNRAMRTLGFAYMAVNNDVADVDAALTSGSELIFVGITAISDPVRDDVPEAVGKCLSAGIQVKIVTGDTPNTAREIARQIGLWNDEDGEENRITGAEFEALSDEEAFQRVAKLKIMSRARPMDKQRLVRLLQQRGEVVAVTGDGTNDAPALNFAQVGLSMGSGTSVAKEASDITLLDDSFNSIATAVMWGRSLYRNIQRFVAFQLTINFVALIIVLFGSIFGTEVPLTVTQMLWVNLIMDTFAAAALASLPPNPLVMKDKPRKLTDFIITKQMTRTIFGVGFLFVAALMTMLFLMGGSGEISVHSLTIFFTTFVMLQFWNLFNAKTLGTSQSAFKELYKNLPFVFVALLILVGQIIIVSFGGEVFRTEPLDLKTWGAIIVSTSVIFWGGELVRLIGRNSKK